MRGVITLETACGVVVAGAPRQGDLAGGRRRARVVASEAGSEEGAKVAPAGLAAQEFMRMAAAMSDAARPRRGAGSKGSESGLVHKDASSPMPGRSTSASDVPVVRTDRRTTRHPQQVHGLRPRAQHEAATGGAAGGIGGDTAWSGRSARPPARQPPQRAPPATARPRRRAHPRAAPRGPRRDPAWAGSRWIRRATGAPPTDGASGRVPIGLPRGLGSAGTQPRPSRRTSTQASTSRPAAVKCPRVAGAETHHHPGVEAQRAQP